MKALQHIRYGEISDSVEFSEIAKPTLKMDEVLIETYAAGVNPLDIKVINGKLKALGRYTFPSTLGYDVSGKIVKIGESVIDFSVGDEVYAYANRQGCFAEFVAIKQNIVSLKPKNIRFEEAAGLPLVSLTAFQVLKRGNLQPAEKILIHAGSGGVGSLAIQIAKSMGAYVYTTTSTDNVKWVKELGADRVIDYKTEDYKTIVKDADMVLDTLGNDYTEDAFKVINKGGRVISLVGPVDKETANRMKLNFVAKWFLAWKRRKITRQLRQQKSSYSLLFMRANAKQLDEVTALVEKGKVKTKIDQIFPFKDIVKALRYVEKGRTKGKVVIKIK